MNLTDIHCHLLPMVDDGPDRVEEAVTLLKEEYRQGVRTIIVTPHYRKHMFEPSMKRVVYSYQQLRKIAQEIGIRLLLGCEYHRSEQMVSDLEKKKRPTMAGSRYVLVEFSTNDLFQTIHNQIYELIIHGFKPIIAHIERYGCCEEITRIEELKKMGALIQVNADAVLGRDGFPVKQYCMELMKADLIDYIGTDAHDKKVRRPNLKKCAVYVSRKMGKEYAERIFVKNPEMIWRSKKTDEKNQYDYRGTKLQRSGSD